MESVYTSVSKILLCIERGLMSISVDSGNQNLQLIVIKVSPADRNLTTVALSVLATDAMKMDSKKLGPIIAAAAIEVEISCGTSCGFRRALLPNHIVKYKVVTEMYRRVQEVRILFAAFRRHRGKRRTDLDRKMSESNCVVCCV